MSLKRGIERDLDIPIRLRAGAPGSLTVLLDGEQIFSKRQSGRYPEAAEIVRLIREKTGERGGSK